MAQPRLYTDLTPWYRLIDPVEDHADEAAAIRAAVERDLGSSPSTLLELGAGAGHNAFHLKRRFACTLSDVAEPMLGLSRTLNPDCEHVVGDMRTLRLSRQFDVVLVHDAIMYMLSETDLRAAVETAFAHTRPGGLAVFAPDAFRETFREGSNQFEAAEEGRAIRGLEWTIDPDVTDNNFLTHYLFLLRQGGEVTAVHDCHEEGLFSVAKWREILSGAGYHVGTFARPIDDDGETDEVFICRRPS